MGGSVMLFSIRELRSSSRIWVFYQRYSRQFASICGSNSGFHSRMTLIFANDVQFEHIHVNSRNSGIIKRRSKREQGLRL